MFQTAGTRKEKARLAIQEMLRRGEDVCSMPIGESGGVMWISADRKKVKAMDVMEIDGTLYFLGFDLK